MITELSIFLPDSPGQFARVLDLLAGNNVNIRGFSVDLGGPYSQVRMVTNEVKMAKDKLKEHGYAVQETSVFLLSMPDAAGRLRDVAKVLGNAGVNIKYGYCTLGPAFQKDQVLVVVKVEERDTDRAGEVLKTANSKDHDALPDPAPAGSGSL